MRTIIRFSLDKDPTSRLRNRLKRVLTSHGFRWKRDVTGSYEHSNISEIDLAVAMAEFWDEVHKIAIPTHLDHFWMYTDNPPLKLNLKLKK